MRQQRGGAWAAIARSMPWRSRHDARCARGRLMAPSARSDVPPFMVMDVMAAAARIEAAGGHVIHMEVGQPAAPAPATAIAAARAALGAAPLGYTEALGIPSLRARIARHLSRDATACRRSRAHRRHHRLVGRLHPGVSGDVRAGRPGGGRRSRLSALSPHPDGARLRAGADRDRARDALCASPARPCSPRMRATPLTGVLVGKPRQSDRHHDDAEALAELIGTAEERGHPLHLRRDLSRPRLCLSGGDGGAAVGARSWSSTRSRNISA